MGKDPAAEVTGVQGTGRVTTVRVTGPAVVMARMVPVMGPAVVTARMVPVMGPAVAVTMVPVVVAAATTEVGMTRVVRTE